VNDTLIFLVLAGLALIFKWLTSQSSKDSDESESPPPNEAPSRRRPPAQTDEERVRRFLEALGVPQGTQPPPPVRPRKVVTPTQPKVRPKAKRSLLQPLPPLVTTPDLPLPPSRSAPPPPTVVVMEPTSVPEVAVLPTVPASIPGVTERAQAGATRPSATTSLGALLRSRASVRQAIILREVLGPPRGLQPLAQIQAL
jgi:hypothetical protein